MKLISLISVLVASFTLQSCARDDTLRTDGLTLGAGDAIAKNTNLQIVDPWPEGVEDTDLLIPNNRSNPKVDGSAPAITPAPANP